MKNLLGLLLFGLTACQPTSENIAGAPETSLPAAGAVAGARQPDQPAQTAVQFLEWYQQHQEKINRLYFIDNADGRDTAKFYAVNFQKAEVYLQALQKSGCVSEAYLNDWRAYFSQWGDTLRMHPQNDGPPAGFDYDLVTHSQEPEIYWEHPQRAKQHTKLLPQNRAVVTLDFTTEPINPDNRYFYLSRINSKWLIDSIAVVQ